jgi:phosphatidylglycerophosphate synthase
VSVAPPRGRLVVARHLLEQDAWLLGGVLVAGLPLLTRQILSLQQAGVHDIDVAAEPDFHESVRTLLQRSPRVPAGVNVVDVTLPPSGAGAGILVQAADLVIDPRAVRQLIQVAQETGRSVSCVDRVEVNYPVSKKSPFVVGAPGELDGRVVDTEGAARDGLVAIGASIVRRVSDTSAAEMAPLLLEIGRYGWHRILGPSDVAAATSKILLGTVKPTDGMYARANRRVSLALSRRLVSLPVTPNQVTLVTLVCSVLAGVVMAGGTYWPFLFGGLIGWFASMLDGVDGELARAKFQTTQLGHWLEMSCDYVYYLSVVGGYGVGFYRSTGDRLWLGLAGAGCAGVVLSFLAVAHNKRTYAQREPGGDYYVAFQRTTSAHAANPVHLFTRYCTFLVTRGAFPYFIVAFALLGLSRLMFAMVLVGTHLSWMLTLYAGRLKPTLAPAARAHDRVPAARRSPRASPAVDEL